jgi:hypothetical protein
MIDTLDKISHSGICNKTGKKCWSRKQAMRQANWWRSHRFANMRHYQCASGEYGHWHVGNVRG